MSKPKIVIIGAGSYFFGRPVIWNMINSNILKHGTLALVDKNPHVLETMMNFAKKAIAAAQVPTKLIGSTDRREVLKDADFVVLSYSRKNAYYRGVDCRISDKYGVRMCSGDTIGPGGIFRALREIPIALEVARDTEQLAPNAWLINFVNPASVLGIALMRQAPNIRSFAICDGLHEPYYRLRYLTRLGIAEEGTTVVPPDMERRLVFHTMGVNHFTWVTKFTYDGKNMLPAWENIMEKQAMKELAGFEKTSNDPTQMDNNAKSKSAFNSGYIYELMKIFKAYPDRISHTKEYVPYFQGLGATLNKPASISIFDAEQRQEIMDARMAETEDYAYGRKPIKEFLDSGRGDHATDIIESMWGGFGKAFYVNCQNNLAVTNMAKDSFLESLCDLDMNGPRPRPMGPMPRGLLGLQQQVLDTHELTAEAAVKFDRDLVLQAMVTDPIINNIGDAKNIMKELFEAEKDILPEKWY